MNTLSLNNIKIKYIDAPDIIINEENVIFPDGINFIVGKNGCGKSTLLKAFTGHEDIDVRGKIEYNNGPLKYSIIGIVNQNPLNSIACELTFAENLIQAKSTYLDFLKPTIIVNKKELNKIITFIKSFNFDFDINKILFKESSKLSSGQQQLLAILMRVYRNGKILLLDECTANLDEFNTNLIIETLIKIALKGVIILFVTHQSEFLELSNTRTYIVANKSINLKIYE